MELESYKLCLINKIYIIYKGRQLTVINHLCLLLGGLWFFQPPTKAVMRLAVIWRLVTARLFTPSEEDKCI
jgi:hypothetical protein